MKAAMALQARAVATLADPRWAAVAARDGQADGSFVYAVTTTGVYCRPSCGARTPRPEHVEFHATPALARAAGFRPCKRCRPDDAPPAQRNAELVARLCRFIDDSDGIPSLALLAQQAGMSPHHLHRIFRAVTGLTPRAYAQARRSQRMRSELVAAPSVTDAIYCAGYSSPGRFYEQSNGMLGMRPTEYRAGGENVDIRFAVGQCSLGAILVAASGRGVCAIALGDDADRLVRDLQDRFPRAALVGADAAFERLVAQVVGFVEAPSLGLDLPLDLRGTAFQQRVWQALRRVPAGRTVSYAELARSIGAPRAVRAVAGACAANTLAVAIPCHRVVCSDGSMSGYRWGVERKRALIEREAGS